MPSCARPSACGRRAPWRRHRCARRRRRMNLAGKRPALATRRSVANFSAAIATLTWNLAGAWRGSLPEATYTTEPMLAVPRRTLRSRMRSTPARSLSAPPVDSSMASSSSSTTFSTSTLSRLSSMTSRALVGRSPMSGIPSPLYVRANHRAGTRQRRWRAILRHLHGRHGARSLRCRIQHMSLSWRSEAGENHSPAPSQGCRHAHVVFCSPLLFVAAFAVDADAARVARQHAPEGRPQDRHHRRRIRDRACTVAGRRRRDRQQCALHRRPGGGGHVHGRSC